MTPQEAAALLNGRQYRREVTTEMVTTLKDAGLVAVYGASDDLMEFEGAIRDEVGCYGGGTAYVTPAGLLANECENDDCPHFKRIKKAAVKIRAKWDDGGFSWRYETEIPHVKFVIKEDDENYCEGIVFALADVPAR
jgi:hypothetical protein